MIVVPGGARPFKRRRAVDAFGPAGAWTRNIAFSLDINRETFSLCWFATVETVLRPTGPHRAGRKLRPPSRRRSLRAPRGRLVAAGATGRQGWDPGRNRHPALPRG